MALPMDLLSGINIILRVDCSSRSQSPISRGGLTSSNSGISNLRNARSTTRDLRYNVCEVVQPAVLGNLEEICSESWVWLQDPTQQITSVWCHIFWKGERSRRNVLVQKVDVVSLWVGWVVIKGQIASQHCVLYHTNQ